MGFTEDLPLISTDGSTEKINNGSLLTLKQVLRSSVGVMGESSMGLTEKIVLSDGKICVLKRFRNVGLRRREFGRRIVRLAMVARHCKYLVPINAYFYAKRIKFVVCEYYPMGSLADLLTSKMSCTSFIYFRCGRYILFLLSTFFDFFFFSSFLLIGARKLGRTALNWNQRLKIIVSVAQAIEYIHTRCFPSENKSFNTKMSVHGNLKASNVMINIDFTARLSDYGFVQLAEKIAVSDTGQRKSPANPAVDFEYSETYSQKSDIYNFGIIILDILRGVAAAAAEGFGQNQNQITAVAAEATAGEGNDEKFKGIIEEDDLFEYYLEGNERTEALKVVDIGWACLHRSPEARPTIDKIVRCLAEIF